ncbi:MAG: dTMP kinase [Candidatus Thalassarchaeaceae archaeon]
MMSKGVLIAVEGLDGSGKSTQAHLLVEWLRSLGAPVHHTEWNSSPLVASSTKKAKKQRRLKPETFHLIHAADFADRYERQIQPLIEVGGIVVCDRYKFTALARDGSRGIESDRIEKCYSFAREPDLTLYFKVSPDVSLSRIDKGRSQLKYYEAGMDMNLSEDPFESYLILQGRQREIYDRLTQSGRMVEIDADRTIPEVLRSVREIINDKFDIDSISILGPKDRMNETLDFSVKK